MTATARLAPRLLRRLAGGFLAPLLACGAETPPIAAPGAGGSGHWIEFRGRPVLPIGDSVTQGWMELGADFDQDAYLHALAERGANALLLWAFIGIPDQRSDPRIGYDAPELWPWPHDEDGRFDLAAFDERYFARLRALVEAANERDLLIVVTVHDGWTKTRFGGHPFAAHNGGPLASREQYVELYHVGTEMPARFDPAWGRRERHQWYLERFCARLIEATADLPNVMYEIFNEGEWYDQRELRAFQSHFLDFFRTRTARPLLVNDDHVGGEPFHADPRVDVVALHKPKWSGRTRARESFEHFARHFALSPPKPYFFTEPVPAFDGDVRMLPGLQRLMWGTALAGAGVVVQNDTSFGFAPGAGIAGRAEARERVLDLEGHLARFVNRELASLAAMVPDGAVASTGVALARRGREYAIYAEAGEALSVDLADAPGVFEARFYDPAAGRFGEPVSVSGGARIQLEKPDDARDWVLHLRATSR